MFTDRGRGPRADHEREDSARTVRVGGGLLADVSHGAWSVVRVRVVAEPPQ